MVPLPLSTLSPLMLIAPAPSRAVGSQGAAAGHGDGRVAQRAADDQCAAVDRRLPV